MVPVGLAERVRRDRSIPAQHGETRPVVPALLQEFVNRSVPMPVAAALKRSKRGELQACSRPSLRRHR
jgi:hypothetical protein